MKLRTRGTTNGNRRGSTADRRARKLWLLKTYRANLSLTRNGGYCRCYRCGCLLDVHTLTVDRIIPGVHGGTYRRNNIRPACGTCNSKHGGAVRKKRTGRVKKTV